MTTEDTFTPTVADLREIAEFIRHRSMDEAGAAGSMQFYRENGVTIHPRIPKSGTLGHDLPGHRAKLTVWLETHSADRFMDMASELASMADALADVQHTVSDVHAKYSARAAWRRLTRAARLWQTHPDFDPAWAKLEEKEAEAGT